MKLIIGLGNPGKKYEPTRHNLGFRAVDAVAEKFNASFIEEARFMAEAAAFDTDKNRIILAKPLTFMNKSGETVTRLKNFYKVRPEDILVVHDEIDLPLGQIRLSKGRGAGHRGAESVLTALGTNAARLRLGIENRAQFRVPDTETYVLQKFTADEEKQITDSIVPEAIKKITGWINSSAK